MNYTGIIVGKTIMKGSKSERTAYVLQTDDGTTYVLRLQGANAFDNSEFSPFANKRVTLSGALLSDRYTLQVANLNDVRPAPSGPAPKP